MVNLYFFSSSLEKEAHIAKTLASEMNALVFNEISYFFKLMIIIHLLHRKKHGINLNTTRDKFTDYMKEPQKLPQGPWTAL